MKSLFCLAVLLLVLPACGNDDDPVVGGVCTFDSVPGTYTVTSIGAPSHENCGDAQDVQLAFQPTSDAGVSSSQPALLLSPSYDDLPSACLTALGVTVGAQFSGTRKIETNGTCAPSYDEINLDVSSCACGDGGAL